MLLVFPIRFARNILRKSSWDAKISLTYHVRVSTINVTTVLLDNGLFSYGISHKVSALRSFLTPLLDGEVRKGHRYVAVPT